MNPNSEIKSGDTTIRDLHEIRRQLSQKFGGDIAAILDEARERQAKSGRRIIARGELSNKANQGKTIACENRQD